MESEQNSGHGNWIDGSWRPPRRGFGFTVESPHLEAPREHLEWPRSGLEEVQAALESAASSRAAWLRESAGSRESQLQRLCDELVGELDLELAQLLDLEDGDLHAHALRLTCLLEERNLHETAEQFSDSELLVARPDWRQLYCGFELTLAALLAGCPVLVLSDCRVPHLARALARAADRAGLPRGVLAVLHDDGRTALRAALTSEQVTDVFVSGDADDLAQEEDLVQRCQRAGGGARCEFGAGLDLEATDRVSGLPRLHTSLIRSTVTVVRLEASVEAEAERVLEESLGRFGALDGVLDGSVGAALCPERRLASFTAELLTQLQDLELPWDGPLALDPNLGPELSRARERGLDEGATLIQGSPGPGRGPGGSLPGARGGILVPTIFTNVEEHMQLVRDRRPAPLLCLMRVASEEAGDELAARLDAPYGS